MTAFNPQYEVSKLKNFQLVTNINNYSFLAFLMSYFYKKIMIHTPKNNTT